MLTMLEVVGSSGKHSFLLLIKETSGLEEESINLPCFKRPTVTFAHHILEVLQEGSVHMGQVINI